MERRDNRRHRVRLSLRMQPGDVASSTADLSVSGVFVRSARVLVPGTVVRLVITTPTGPAWAEGVVRWARRVPPQLLAYTRGGMGVELTRVSPELRAYLGDLTGVCLVATAP